MTLLYTGGIFWEPTQLRCVLVIISLHFETLCSNIGLIFGCRFAAEGMTLGKGEKRVKQVLTIPIEDNGGEDLYSHLSDIIHFIGKKTECGR